MTQVSVTAEAEITVVTVTLSPDEAAKIYAQEAEASAAAALASEQAAELSETNAETAETNAETAAATATTQAGISTTQAGISTTQAGIATTQAGLASASQQSAALSAQSAYNSELAAATQAGIATTQAGIATTQAGNALTSANNALNSANAAAASASAAAQVGTSTLLTGFSVGGNTAIAPTDSILQGFNKTQGQLNARAVISGTPVAGQVAFWTAANTQAGDSGFIWNNTDKALAINGTQTNYGAKLEVVNANSPGALTIGLQIRNPVTDANTGSILSFIFGPNNTAVGAGSIRVVRTGTVGVSTYFMPFTTRISGTEAERFRISETGNLLINTTTDAGFRLDVNGTARVQGALTLTSNLILPTVTGTRIGTATNQLISFWNKTPIVQPTTGIAGATLAGSGGSTITSGNTFGGYTVQQIAQALINIGILA